MLQPILRECFINAIPRSSRSLFCSRKHRRLIAPDSPEEGFD
jgi:hypothetical protein